MGQSVEVATLTQITDFVESSTGLEFSTSQATDIRVKQKIDGKSLSIIIKFVDRIISRVDSEGLDFLQVNFEDGQKLLLTQTLVGFKPIPLTGLDMSKLPKVVTTPDLISVIEAIEETMNATGSHPIEVEVLRRVFSAVLKGGEAIGFDLTRERAWLDRITPVKTSTSA